MRKLFIDTGPLVARINDKDPDHVVVQEILASIKTRRIDVGFMYTTNYIIDEAVTHILYTTRRHDLAVKVLNLVEASGVINVSWVDEPAEARARVIFKKYTDQGFSFTDCTSFAVMEREGIKDAFTFDARFTIMGFAVVP